MQELRWALGLGVMAVLYASLGIVPPFALVGYGRELMLSAAALGVPLELLYFALLGWALWVNGGAPRGWYWRSFDHHELLTARQRPWVLTPFYLGALAFLAIALGIAIVLLGFFAAVSQR